MPSSANVFISHLSDAYPFQYRVRLRIRNLAGGVPSNANVIESWLATKVGKDDDEAFRAMVAKTMLERGVSLEEATEEASKQRSLNGFKRTAAGILYIEGRQVKAAIKEAISICVAADKLPKRGWGATNKAALGFAAEHIMIAEDNLWLHPVGFDGNPYVEPTIVNQKFVHTFRGSGLQQEEIIGECEVEFILTCDFEFPEKFWPMVWLTGGENGIGASRSQGFGRYDVVVFEQLSKRQAAQTRWQSDAIITAARVHGIEGVTPATIARQVSGPTKATKSIAATPVQTPPVSEPESAPAPAAPLVPTQPSAPPASTVTTPPAASARTTGRAVKVAPAPTR